MVDSSEKHSFGQLRSIFWPIHRYESRKLLAMVVMSFLIAFNYSILRNVKDTIVITAAGSGAEIIPFVKVWAMLPMAIIMTWVFTKLTARFRRELVFYIMVTGFVTYFLIFTFVLYPLLPSLQPLALCQFLTEHLPAGSKGFIAMLLNWPCTLFYAMSELWSSIVFCVLFWGFANDITSLPQAGRFYGVLNVASSFAAFAAGQTAIICSNNYLLSLLPIAGTPWEQTFTTLILVVTASSGIIVATYRWMYLRILPNPTQECTHALENNQSTFKKKKKLSIRESVKHLAKSKYLICLAILVVAYNLGINLIEVAWKSKVRELYPASQDFNLYLNKMTSIMGVLSTLIALFIPLLISRLGWTFMALLTPVVMLVTAIGFFAFDFCSTEQTGYIVSLVGISPLIIAVFFGSANNVLSKSAKYSVFDASKEMAFIPLPKEERITGKAAIDGIGSRLGKSGGSFVQQGLLLCVGSLSMAMPWIALILGIVITTWTTATVILGKKFKRMTHPHTAETVALPSSTNTTEQEAVPNAS